MDKEIVSGGEKLYKSIFPPKFPNIAFIGLVRSIGSIMPVSDIQAQYVTSLWTGKLLSKLPTQIEMEEDIIKNQETERKNSCHVARSSMIPYADDLAKDIGCLPYSSKV